MTADARRAARRTRSACARVGVEQADPDRAVEQLVVRPPVRRAGRLAEVLVEAVAVDEPGARLDGVAAAQDS